MGLIEESFPLGPPLLMSTASGTTARPGTGSEWGAGRPGGKEAPTIHADANETDTDLVVVSTHALTIPGWDRVAAAVVRTSHRAALLAGRPKRTPRHREAGVHIANSSAARQ